MSEEEKLLAFCDSHKKILCYGAGLYGYTVKRFLEYSGRTVEFFLVSHLNREKQEEGVLYKDNIPIYSVTEINIDLSQYGVILSLPEKYHNAVKELLKEKFPYSIDLYIINKDNWKNFFSSLIILRSKSVLGEHYNRMEEDCYEKRAKEIDAHYNSVQIRYTTWYSMGAMGTWIAYLKMKEEEQYKGVFLLYYPYTPLEQYPEDALKGANSFLLSKFQDEGIEAISEHNIDFWRFYIKTRQGRVKFDQEIIFYEKINEDRFNVAYSNEEENEEYIALTPEDNENGKRLLEEMNLKIPYVCLSSRDMFYWTCRKGQMENPYMIYRNSDIKTRGKAIQYLTDNNIYTVRIGAGVTNDFENDMCIDYARKWRTEFMDVYIVSKCKFFVSDLSGIMGLAQLFSKPMVITNASLVTTRGDSPPFLKPSRDIAIVKKMWDVRHNRYLTLKEMLSFEVKSINVSYSIPGVFDLYHNEGIVPVENTEKEIWQAVKEMNETLDGIRTYDSLDIELRERYFDIVGNYPLNENMLNRWRIGADFLRENQWWLE